ASAPRSSRASRSRGISRRGRLPSRAAEGSGRAGAPPPARAQGAPERARAGAGAPARPRGRTRRAARGAGVRPVRARADRVIVRWGLGSLPEACAEAGVSSPLLVASPRWDSLELPVQPAAHWPEVPSDRIGEAVAAASDADGVLAVGGGSAIDLGKAISAAAALPLVSVPPASP